jgi:hypothetical protein
MSADRMPISRGIAPLADIPDREGGDGGPELVIRGEHPVIAMPALPRWRHGESSTAPLAPGRVVFRPRPEPTQLAALCRGST